MKPKLWSRGIAREYMMGYEPTMNPSAAATFMLKQGHGSRALSRALERATSRRKSFHRGNPLPAALMAGGLLGGLGKRFGPGSDRYGPDGSIKPGNNGPLATTVQQFLDQLRNSSTSQQALRSLYSLAHNPGEKHRSAWLSVWQNEIPPRLSQLDTATKNAARQLDPSLATSPAAGGGGGVSELGQFANSQLAATLGKTLIQQAVPRATRARTTARVKQVTRYDPATGDKYKVPSNSAEAAQWPSRKPSARSLSGYAGGAAAAAPVAAKAAGLAGAGAGAIAGVVIGGLAVGVLIGTGLRKLFGTAKAVRAEEAAVDGALALRNTRTQLEQQLGRKLNATETRALFGEYENQLVQLGFQKNAAGMWHRPRTFTERLLG